MSNYALVLKFRIKESDKKIKRRFDVMLFSTSIEMEEGEQQNLI